MNRKPFGKGMRRVLCALFALLLSGAAAEAANALLPAMNVSGLRLIDSVDMAALEGREHIIDPANARSGTQTILGKNAFVMPGGPGAPFRFVAVRLGAGKGMKTGQAYVLRVEYPEDAPRSYTIYNSATETRRGFHSGATLGDALKMPYVWSNPESLAYPLSGRWEAWTCVFEPHPHYPDFPKPGKRNQTPADGFWVVIAVYNHENDPVSAGLALGTISLYEAPPHERLALRLRRPPAGLPQRHVFWREEMSDGLLFDQKNPAFDAKKQPDWYAAKMRLAKFLGFDTFSRDLLEFGHNQGWDSSRYGSNDWVYQSNIPWLWHETVKLAGQYGLYVLPMYEYCGSIGGSKALGPQKRAQTLGYKHKGPKGRDDYTHIHWSEKANIDVTDPDFIEDLRKILEITIADERENATFLGAWLRPRSAGMPISFSDRTRQRFDEDTKAQTPTTRQALQSNRALYDQYIRWWNLKRRAYFEAIRDYLRRPDVAGSDAALLFTGDPSEPGNIIDSNAIVTDDAARFPGAKTISPEQVVAEHLGLRRLTAPSGTWGGWEWQHAVPAADPQNYKETPGIFLTMPFSRQYSVADPEALEAFRAKDGLAMIYHHPLNEHVYFSDKLGYFVVDFELAGPYCMLAEARALANGDPRYIGYLYGNSLQRGFPQYVRAFYAAFLALPALPSRRLDNAASHPDVVVRAIPTPKDGVWFAIINTGMRPAENVRLSAKFAALKGLQNYLTGKPVSATAPLSLYPGQVLVWHAPGRAKSAKNP